MVDVLLKKCIYLDIDECETATHNCSWGASCNNRNGSFYCTCSPGFSGDGFRCAGENMIRLLK